MKLHNGQTITITTDEPTDPHTAKATVLNVGTVNPGNVRLALIAIQETQGEFIIEDPQ